MIKSTRTPLRDSERNESTRNDATYRGGSFVFSITRSNRSFLSESNSGSPSCGGKSYLSEKDFTCFSHGSGIFARSIVNVSGETLIMECLFQGTFSPPQDAVEEMLFRPQDLLP